MNAIVDWEYYHSFYPVADHGSFTRLEPLAEREVRSIVGVHRWNSINPTHFYYEQLKDCVCKVISMLFECDKSGAGKGLSSVNNDGYTESYAVQTRVQADAEVRACIVKWLSGTGLVGAYKC